MSTFTIYDPFYNGCDDDKHDSFNIIYASSVAAQAFNDHIIFDNKDFFSSMNATQDGFAERLGLHWDYRVPPSPFCLLEKPSTNSWLLTNSSKLENILLCIPSFTYC